MKIAPYWLLCGIPAGLACLSVNVPQTFVLFLSVKSMSTSSSKGWGELAVCAHSNPCTGRCTILLLTSVVFTLQLHQVLLFVYWRVHVHWHERIYTCLHMYVQRELCLCCHVGRSPAAWWRSLWQDLPQGCPMSQQQSSLSQLWWSHWQEATGYLQNRGRETKARFISCAAKQMRRRLCSVSLKGKLRSRSACGSTNTSWESS